MIQFSSMIVLRNVKYSFMN